MELSEFLGESVTTPIEEDASPVEIQAPEQPAQEPATTAEQPAAIPRDEQGRFVKADSEPPAATPAQQPEERPHTVPVSAMLEERRKRQELEARLAAITAQPPDDVKDEDFIDTPVEATRKIVGRQAQHFETQVRNIKYDIAEDMTRTMHTDYDAVREQFVTRAAAGDPAALAIAQQMDAQPNPARFMYEQTKRLAAVESVGDPAAYEARIRAEERARVLAELGKGPAKKEVPRSLNSEPSATTPASGQPFEATPLENLVTFNF